MQDASQIRIIVVDDDELDTIVIRRGVAKLGWPNVVESAPDAESGLSLIREVCSEHPVLVLLDINMPRTSGLQLLEKIRHDPDLRRIVVFMLSTSHSPSDVNHAHDLQVSGYLVKPVGWSNTREMLQKLSAYMDMSEFPT